MRCELSVHTTKDKDYPYEVIAKLDVFQVVVWLDEKSMNKFIEFALKAVEGIKVGQFVSGTVVTDVKEDR